MNSDVLVEIELLHSSLNTVSEERDDLRRKLNEALTTFREDRERWEKERRQLKREIEMAHARGLEGTDPEWAV